ASEFIAQQGWLPPDARLFNSYDLGGYLAWRLHGRARILIDSRNEAYGDEITREVLESFGDVASFLKAIRRWHPDLLVLSWRRMRDGHPVLRHLEGKSGWSLVFIDDSTAVYCPQERAAEPIRFATPGTFDLRRIGPAEAAAALKEGHRLSAWQQDGVLASLVTAR